MALQKTLKLKNGATGTYFKVGLIHMDIDNRFVSAHFNMYTDEITRRSQPNEPLRAKVAFIRLSGDQFDKYFSTAALKGTHHVAQIYKAAKVEGVVSDYSPDGGTLFSDATDC